MQSIILSPIYSSDWVVYYGQNTMVNFFSTNPFRERRYLMKKLTTILLIFLLLLSFMPVSVLAENTPATIEATIDPGGVENDLIRVCLPESAPTGDVVFIFDDTGSMGGVINTVKAKAGTIMTGVRGAIPDTNFGVGSFVDYPHSYNSFGYDDSYGGGDDYAWQTDLDLTSDTTAVQTAINGIVLHGGSDIPQDYARALYEAQFYSWRPDAKKIVVIFGDAPPHAGPGGCSADGGPFTCNAGTGTGPYGGDPGRDEVMGNADDLSYVNVVADLAAQNIIVLGVNSGPAAPDNAGVNFNYMSAQTGGTAFAYTDETIDDEIIALIEGISTAPVDLNLGVREPGYASWVTWDPADGYFEVPWGECRDFDVTITVPADASGDHTFHIDGLGDGVIVGTTTVTKHVGEIPDIP